MTSADVVLVTGATGFIGRHLALRMLDQGRQVACLVRVGRESALPAGVRAVVLSADQEQLRRAVQETGATSCVHLAAHFRAQHDAVDIGPLVDGNVKLTAAVADACARAGVRRFVFTGTVWQHHGSRGYSPMSLYAATKQAACDVLRHFARNDGLASHVVKLPDSYGPGDPRRKVVDLLLDAAATGASLGMSPGAQLLDLVHVDDVVDGLMLLEERQSSGWEEWSIGSGEPLPLRQLAARVEEVTGRRLNIVWGAHEYRVTEAFEPWDAGPWPEGWAPATSLADGIGQLWQSRVSA